MGKVLAKHLLISYNEMLAMPLDTVWALLHELGRQAQEEQVRQNSGA